MIEDNSNPSYSDAVNNMRQTNTQNISDVKFSGILQAQAILADAYERRTASLIAYWDAMSASEEPWADTPFQRELDAIHRDIRVRLGRAPEVSK